MLVLNELKYNINCTNIVYEMVLCNNINSCYSPLDSVFFSKIEEAVISVTINRLGGLVPVPIGLHYYLHWVSSHPAMNRNSGTHCAVVGCTYNRRKLNELLQRPCYEHFPSLRSACECGKPFTFHRIPADPDLTRQWLAALRLKNPPQHIFVCSFHFVDKKPTKENPIPQLFLGYEKKVTSRRILVRTAVSAPNTSGHVVAREETRKRKSSTIVSTVVPEKRQIMTDSFTDEMTYIEEIARDALHKTGKYQVVSGLISPVNDAYQKKDLASVKHRCEMLKAALKTSDWIKMDAWECVQSAWTPTAEVLHHYKQQVEAQYGSTNKPSASKRRKKQHKSITDVINNQESGVKTEEEHVPSVKLLCGGDLLESFAVPDLWKAEDIEYIVGTHGLVVITRSGTDPLKFIYESDILTKFKENIFIVTEWIFNDISSTKVRRALYRDESVKYLLQDSVIDYIRENKLYGATKKEESTQPSARMSQ